MTQLLGLVCLVSAQRAGHRRGHAVPPEVHKVFSLENAGGGQLHCCCPAEDGPVKQASSGGGKKRSIIRH